MLVDDGTHEHLASRSEGHARLLRHQTLPLSNDLFGTLQHRQDQVFGNLSAVHLKPCVLGQFEWHGRVSPVEAVAATPR